MLCDGISNTTLVPLSLESTLYMCNNHSALRYLCEMQDTSSWAITLQSFDLIVKHESRKFHIVPRMLSRLFKFEQQVEDNVTPMLAPICRNVSDDPILQVARRRQQFQLSADKLENLEPVRSDRELFTVKQVHLSATNVFMYVDQE